MGTMTAVEARRYIVIGLLLALFTLRLLLPQLPWSYIAASLALIAAILTLAAEAKRESGDKYETPEERDDEKKVKARGAATLMMAVAFALVFFSALIPVLEIPKAGEFVLVGDHIDEVTFRGSDSVTRLNPMKLKAVLRGLQAGVDSSVIRDPGGRLLVANCGLGSVCKCPTGYVAVPDSGGWNLNDQTNGAAIRLCSR